MGIEMPPIGVDDFTREVECIFEGERYSVRDNGAVLRHPSGKRTRAADNQWTFGKENAANPYLLISGVRIHRIVATAFHGAPPDPKHVVDHIDSNCKNNRPENLRWLTRLENALKNPATRSKIEYLCGSIEAFLNNPSMLNDLRGDPSFGWMRAVTTEEAQNCLVRMNYWAEASSKAQDFKRKAIPPNAVARRTFEDRAFKPLQKWEVGLGREPGLDLTQTPWCAQYMWDHDRHFPSCPNAPGEDFLGDYFRNLIAGAVLSYADHDATSTTLTVVRSEILREKSSGLVMCKGISGHLSVVGITLDEKSRHFIHYLLGSYSTEGEADSTFLAQKESPNFWSAAYNASREPGSRT